MNAINYAMTDIYGGYAGTTEMTIPDPDDQNALTDTSTTNTTPIAKGITQSSNVRMYLAIALVLILVIVIGGKM